MADFLSVLGNRSPNLADLLEGYAGRIGALGEGEGAKFWVWRAAKRLAAGAPTTMAEWLLVLDRIAAVVREDGDNAAVLRGKFGRCLPARAVAHREHYDTQLLDTFAEMLGYDYLRRAGYGPLRFLPEGPEPGPDVEGFGGAGRKPVVMECKNLHNSDEQKNYFAHHQGEVRTVDCRLVSPDPAENPLLRKLRDAAARATVQFNAYVASQYRRILFLNYTLDIPVVLIEDEFPGDVESLFRCVAFELHQREIDLVLVDRYGLGKTREFCRS